MSCVSDPHLCVLPATFIDSESHSNFTGLTQYFKCPLRPRVGFKPDIDPSWNTSFARRTETGPRGYHHTMKLPWKHKLLTDSLLEEEAKRLGVIVPMREVEVGDFAGRFYGDRRIGTAETRTSGG